MDAKIETIFAWYRSLTFCYTWCSTV